VLPSQVFFSTFPPPLLPLSPTCSTGSFLLCLSPFLAFCTGRFRPELPKFSPPKKRCPYVSESPSFVPLFAAVTTLVFPFFAYDCLEFFPFRFFAILEGNAQTGPIELLTPALFHFISRFSRQRHWLIAGYFFLSLIPGTIFSKLQPCLTLITSSSFCFYGAGVHPTFFCFLL